MTSRSLAWPSSPPISSPKKWTTSSWTSSTTPAPIGILPTRPWRMRLTASSSDAADSSRTSVWLDHPENTPFLFFNSPGTTFRVREGISVARLPRAATPQPGWPASPGRVGVFVRNGGRLQSESVAAISRNGGRLSSESGGGIARNSQVTCVRHPTSHTAESATAFLPPLIVTAGRPRTAGESGGLQPGRGAKRGLRTGGVVRIANSWRKPGPFT